jgi:NADH-quinone oxidoreductase subunit E
MELNLVMTIVDRERAQTMENICQNLKLPLTLTMLCQGTACHVNSSELILQTIKDELGIDDGQTTADGLFSLKCVACLGCCSLSPVMMINEDTYGSLTPDKTKKILKELREAAL